MARRGQGNPKRRAMPPERQRRPRPPLKRSRCQPASRTHQTSQPSQSRAPTVSAFDPTGVFGAQPRSRIAEAVSQGLTILAGLALGSSVVGG